jgi:transposase InsO family protein
MYHCVIRDIVTGEVLGDHMADRMTKELVVNAILAMLAQHETHEGRIFHSDIGSQYTSKAVKGLLQQYELRQSFLRVGMPGDNAWSKSILCDHEERADILDALRDEGVCTGSSV